LTVSLQRIKGYLACSTEVVTRQPAKSTCHRQVLFAVKFVPAERVKYAGACEIACGSEIRLRRVGERISFHIDRREIFHNFRKEIISHSA
jgi:hypothetical protein